jgi:hypothetical protein
MFKLCTNKNHSYKRNEQINSQNIVNSECFGVKFVTIYPEMISQYFFEKNMVLVDYIGISFTFPKNLWTFYSVNSLWKRNTLEN